MTDFDYTSRKIAEILLSAKAVKVSMNPPFTWTSGIKAPIYCDNRLLIALPDARKEIVEGFKNMIDREKLSFDYIAGTATAGIPWASFLAYDLNVPMVYIRPEPKAHGSGKQIEGFLPAQQKVLLIEDLISTGGSSLKAAAALQQEGKAEVTAILAIMDYQLEKAQKSFQEAALHFHSLTNFTTLAELAVEIGSIDDVKPILEFQKNPEKWGELFIMPSET